MSQASLQGFSFQVRSAGLVVVDAGVDAQGAVQDVRLLKDVAPSAPSVCAGVPSRVMVAGSFVPRC